ncbi:MAG: hemagglutinin repeat-containing protein [Pseudomonadota bacterium]
MRATTSVEGSARVGRSGKTAQLISVKLTAPGVIDLTAAQLKSTQGDIRITGGDVSIQSGINQRSASYKETHKMTGVNLGDLTGLFTPGEGVGFKSTLTTEAAHTSLAKASLDARNIAIQSAAGDLTLAAVDASADSIRLDAAHNLNLTSLTTTDYQSTDLKKKDLA